MQAVSQHQNLKSIFAFALQIFIFVFLCSAESIFFSPRNSLIEIDLWMVSLIFICLHRTLITGLFFCALASLFFSAFSGMPHHAALLSYLSVFAVLHIIKNRSFTQGPSYFSICAFVSILTFYAAYFSFSWIFGENPILNPNLIKWTTSALMSAALFTLIRPLLIFSDSLFSVTYPFGFEV